MKTSMEDAVRRSADIVLAGGALIVLSPVFAAIAIAIRTDGPGPVIFRQQRVGRHGRPFTIYKFRTMRPESAGPSVTASDDPRITNVGRRLRATKLDELPQLFNVLRGDMSLVGPRPEVPLYVAKWPDRARALILSVRPGITDPVTLSLRDEELLLSSTVDPAIYYESVLLPAKTSMQSAYVIRRSLAEDAQVLTRTLWALRRAA